MAKPPEINVDVIRGLVPILREPGELSIAHERAEAVHPFFRFAHHKLHERFETLTQPSPEELNAINMGIIAYEALASSCTQAIPPEHALAVVRGFFADPRFNLGIRESIVPITSALIERAEPLAAGVKDVCKPQLDNPDLTRYAQCGAAMMRAAHHSAETWMHAA